MVMGNVHGASHRASRSGSVWARKTRSRGASISRVMMAWGIPGSAMICVSDMLSSFRPGPLAAAVLVELAGLQGRQQFVQPFVALVPEPLVAGQPGGHVAQWLGLQAAEPGGRTA